MILAIGLGCTVYAATELLGLARAGAAGDPGPGARAREALTGRPLTLRPDRRRSPGRRRVDRPGAH